MSVPAPKAAFVRVPRQVSKVPDADTRRLLGVAAEVAALLGRFRRADPIRRIVDLSHPTIARLVRVRAQRQPMLHGACRLGARLDRVSSLAMLDPCLYGGQRVEPVRSGSATAM